MNSFDSKRSTQEESMKRRWQSFNHHQISSNSFLFTKLMGGTSPSYSSPEPSSLPVYSRNPSFNSKFLQHGFPGLDNDDHISAVVPPVTVVLEGRSICQRISLHKHESYQSLARALRLMFVDEAEAVNSDEKEKEKDELDLSNAIPGYLIAYEDMENDLLLAGDLNWKDFVRVAKRIRILPAKSNSRKSPQRSAA